MLELRITPQAESDLLEIWLHTQETWGAKKADSYLDQFAAAFDFLLNNPLMGTDYDHIAPGYRRLAVEQHLVFYKLQDESLLIVRVLHQAMDAPRSLGA